MMQHAFNINGTPGIDYDPNVELYWAISMGVNTIIEPLIKKGADPNAAMDRDLCARVLREHSIRTERVSVKRDFGLDAVSLLTNFQLPGRIKRLLHKAAQVGNANACTILIKNGADPNPFDHLGNTPLMYAFDRDDPHTAEALLRAGARPILGVHENDLIVIDSIKREKLRFLKAIIPHLPQKLLNAQDSEGYTSLMLSIKKKNFDLANQLIQLGADPNLKNAKGLTAYDVLKKLYFHNKDSLLQLIETLQSCRQPQKNRSGRSLR